MDDEIKQPLLLKLSKKNYIDFTLKDAKLNLLIKLSLKI